jgi:arylsulfatase A
MVCWPGKIPPAQTSDALMSAMDLLPTLCRAAGIDLKKHTQNKPMIDGLDVWNTWLGNAEKHPRTELLHWHGKYRKPLAITRGDWKLFFDKRDAVTSADPTKRPEGPADPALYHLKEDIAELKDVGKEFPEKIKELRERADELMQELDSSDKLKILTP